MKKRFAVGVLTMLAIQVAGVRAQNEPLKDVDPTVGTASGGGAMYPGAALPFAMVKLSPDTTNPSTAGYNPKEPILGFSHTHIGGTGGSAFGGQIRLRPQVGALDVAAAASPKANEKASPGYYAVDFAKSNIHIELTSTERAGFQRYTFPAGAPARVLIDVTASINNASPEKPSGVSLGSTAKFTSDHEAEGQATIKAGYGGMTYTTYFVAVFDQPAAARGTWIDGKANPDALDFKGNAKQLAGLYADFAPGATVNVRVGISFTSLELARKNLAVADGMSFDQIHARAESIWRKHFETIQIEGGTAAQRRQFYTALYHTVFTPIDVTGDNGKFVADDQAFYWDVYTLWDTFRSTDPLRILIHPQRERDLITSLLAVYKKTGWLPDAWVYNKKGIAEQGGTHADNLIADAVVKKLGGFDEALAYEAIRKDASQSDPKNDKQYPNSGRMPPYLTLGYVPGTKYDAKDKGPLPANVWGSNVSRTLEYAYNDFCVGEVAAALGKTEDAVRFRKQALNCYKLFEPTRRLFWAKDEQGKFSDDPADGTKATFGWMNMFYEGSAWQYRFTVPHDIAGLSERLGGNEAFVKTLDEFFDRKLDFVGNEPGFLTPWLYDYVGRPDKTADRVRAILAKDFKLMPAGYPGDEDVGAMSAWYLFASMGFFPNAGQDVYLLSSPLFTKTTIKLGDSGKTFVISAPGLSAANKYVQSATLNGKPWDQAWLRHADLIDGAELVLTMGSAPSAWGTIALPPSMSTSTTRP